MKTVRLMRSMRALGRVAPGWSLCACGTPNASQSAGPSRPAAGMPAAAEYPAPLRGRWMPEDMACTSPINYDSDSLVVIDNNRLGHYEDASMPIEVRQISPEPQAWSIRSLLNVGGDGYDTPISDILVLGGGKLGIAGTDGVRVYQK